MWKQIVLGGLTALLITGTCQAQLPQPASIDDQATHVDSSKIKVAGINAFCLNREGQILAACGAGPGMIRVLDDQGQELRSWEVAIKPEAINVTAQGDVLVAGVGKLMRFSSAGELLGSADSPHAAALREGSDQLREAAITQLKRSSSGANYRTTIDAYKQIIAQLEAKKEKGELSEQEERVLTSLPQSLKIYEERLAEQEAREKAGGEDKPKGPTEAEIKRLVDSMLSQKMRVASISTDGSHTFIATPATVGYGYDVWKMNNDFSGGETVVTGLRGCCGQMDVQCCEAGIFVAENARHRVVCYDAEGKEKASWGKRDRTGVDGFTSCCNPMNVCFNSAGEVFTAESTTGRIKRFSAQGEFLSYVGDVKLVPGCKNVSIAVSPQGERVYMLDITRGHIVVMTKKPDPTVAAKSGD